MQLITWSVGCYGNKVFAFIFLNFKLCPPSTLCKPYKDYVTIFLVMYVFFNRELSLIMFWKCFSIFINVLKNYTVSLDCIYFKKWKLKWLLGLRKLRSSKKVEILQVVLGLRVVSWKNIFYHGGEKRRFFLIFTMKLSFAALKYSNAHSTLDFARTVLYF